MPSPPKPPAHDPVQSARARGPWGLERPGLGLSLAGTHGPEQAERHRAWVALGESLRLHSVWLPEMHFSPGVCPAPLVELAGFAASTERMRLGTTSLLLPLHPPAQIAAEIATLDQLSGGRLLVGLGRGFQKRMLEAFGVPPSEKRDRFDDALERILSHWSQARRSPRGVAPTQQPHPPLAVAAFGPKGLAQAARHGLPYLASPVETLDQIEENQRLHRAKLAGDGEPPLSLVMRTVFVSEDEAERAAIRAALEREMQARGAGMPKAVQRAMAAPLDERAVVGTPEAVRARLIQDRARLGIDLLIVRPQVAGVEHAALTRSLTCLANEVWPAVVAAGR